MAKCTTACSSWQKVALRGFLGALIGSLAVFSVMVLTHDESTRGTF